MGLLGTKVWLSGIESTCSLGIRNLDYIADKVEVEKIIEGEFQQVTNARQFRTGTSFHSSKTLHII